MYACLPHAQMVFERPRHAQNTKLRNDRHPPDTKDAADAVALAAAVLSVKGKEIVSITPVPFESRTLEGMEADVYFLILTEEKRN